MNTKKTYVDVLRHLGACSEGLTFAIEAYSFENAWDTCPEPEWRMWCFDALFEDQSIWRETAAADTLKRLEAVATDWPDYEVVRAYLSDLVRAKNERSEIGRIYNRLMGLRSSQHEVLAGALWLTTTDNPAYTYGLVLIRLNRITRLPEGKRPHEVLRDVLREDALKGMANAIERLGVRNA
jgi:hypothetical protein